MVLHVHTNNDSNSIGFRLQNEKGILVFRKELETSSEYDGSHVLAIHGSDASWREQGLAPCNKSLKPTP